MTRIDNVTYSERRPRFADRIPHRVLRLRGRRRHGRTDRPAADPGHHRGSPPPTTSSSTNRLRGNRERRAVTCEMTRRQHDGNSKHNGSKDRRIRANAVSPGAIDTPGLSGLLASSETGQQRLRMISNNEVD
jgi:hypothetical protein